MEVGDQIGDHLKLVAGQDEQVGVAGRGRDAPPRGAKVSSVRTTVVPTATTGRPSCCARRMLAAAAAPTVEALAIQPVLAGIVGRHRPEGAGPDVQGDARDLVARGRDRRQQLGVKCSPAVGAATAPGAAAKTVW